MPSSSLVDVLSVSLRALSFIALFQAAGLAIFVATFGSGASATEPALRRLGTLAAIAALLLVAAQYMLEAGRMAGELAGVIDPALQGVAMHSALSVTLAWRLLGLLLVLAAFCSHRSWAAVLGVLGAALALASFTFVGHTVNQPQRWLLSVSLLGHLLGVAFWFGALLPLWRISASEPPALASQFVDRFSRLAVWLVPGLFLAGLTLALCLLPNLAALDKPYGRLLIVKVSGFAVLMGFAALNKRRLGPALARGDAAAAGSLRRSLAAEYLLIAAILCVTAVLTTFYSP
jgi:putative copper resistance protein D